MAKIEVLLPDRAVSTGAYSAGAVVDRWLYVSSHAPQVRYRRWLAELIYWVRAAKEVLTDVLRISPFRLTQDGENVGLRLECSPIVPMKKI